MEPKLIIVQEFKNYLILDDNTNYYLLVNEWSNFVNALNSEAEYNIKFYISLLRSGIFYK